MNQTEFRKLLETRTENQKIDYKEKFNWLSSSKAEKGGLVKDILSFSNVAGGGRIVFGVRDVDFEPVGLAKDEFESFDATSLNNYIRQYTDPIHSCILIKHVDEERCFVIIEVPEFSSEPILCKKDLQDDNGRVILQKGALYFRTESAESTIVKTSNDMRDVLSRALKNRADEILKGIRALLLNQQNEASFLNRYDEFQTYARDLIQEKIGGSISGMGFGTTEVTIRPSTDLSEMIADPFLLRERMKRAQVSYRGWDFPHEQNNKNNGDTFTIEKGILSFTKWNRHLEALCLFQNGFLYWKAAFWEDSENTNSKRALSFIGFIYSTMEYILFINRYYDFDALKPDIRLNIKMDGCSDRILVSNYPGIMLWDRYECKVDKIDVAIEFNVAESISDPKYWSKKIALGVFQYFNFNIEDSVIDQWQERFLTRKF